jgi:hypothetical protein
MAIHLPTPREFGWNLKPVESAHTSVQRLGDGRMTIAIDHAIIRGITTGMLAWWFQSFDREVTWEGRALQAYLLWHPLDHVHVTAYRGPTGRLGVGDRLHIQEVFGRDPRFTVDQGVRIHRWDANGIGFHAVIGGLRVFNLDHAFEDVADGVRYRSRALIGAEGWLGRLVNTIAQRAFTDETARAWCRHNVEEVGCFENFLAPLWEREQAGRG